MNETLKFQLELIDKMTKPGKEAEAQMKKLRLQLQASTVAVKQTEAAMKKLQAAKVVDIASYKQLNAQLIQQKNHQAGLQSEILAHAGTMNEQAEEVTGLKGAFEALGPVFKAFGVAYAAELAVIGGGVALSLHANELKNGTIGA